MIFIHHICLPTGKVTGEMTLTKVLADLIEVLDSGNFALLVLLDISTAFDTVDHAILLIRLET